MYTFNWALTAFRSESYIGSATALPDTIILLDTRVHPDFLYIECLQPTFFATYMCMWIFKKNMTKNIFKKLYMVDMTL